MIKELGNLHAQYGIYPEALLDPGIENSIVQDISRIYVLEYLVNFYQEYLGEYKATVKKNVNNKNVLSGAARSVDLPFIGQDVLKQKKAKFMFVFEGSLQDV